MEESRCVYTLPVLYNEQSGRNEGVCVRKELGVVVAIDNEDEFKGVFSKDGEVDVFKQLLSQEVCCYYTEHNVFCSCSYDCFCSGNYHDIHFGSSGTGQSSFGHTAYSEKPD